MFRTSVTPRSIVIEGPNCGVPAGTAGRGGGLYVSSLQTPLVVERVNAVALQDARVGFVAGWSGPDGQGHLTFFYPVDEAYCNATVPEVEEAPLYRHLETVSITYAVIPEGHVRQVGPMALRGLAPIVRIELEATA